MGFATSAAGVLGGTLSGRRMAMQDDLELKKAKVDTAYKQADLEYKGKQLQFQYYNANLDFKAKYNDVVSKLQGKLGKLKSENTLLKSEQKKFDNYMSGLTRLAGLQGGMTQMYIGQGVEPELASQYADQWMEDNVGFTIQGYSDTMGYGDKFLAKELSTDPPGYDKKTPKQAQDDAFKAANTQAIISGIQKTIHDMSIGDIMVSIKQDELAIADRAQTTNEVRAVLSAIATGLQVEQFELNKQVIQETLKETRARTANILASTDEMIKKGMREEDLAPILRDLRRAEVELTEAETQYNLGRLPVQVYIAKMQAWANIVESLDGNAIFSQQDIDDRYKMGVDQMNDIGVMIDDGKSDGSLPPTVESFDPDSKFYDPNPDSKVPRAPGVQTPRVTTPSTQGSSDKSDEYESRRGKTDKQRQGGR